MEESSFKTSKNIKIFGIICILTSFELYLLLHLKEIFSLSTKNNNKEDIINSFRNYIIKLENKELDEVYNILIQINNNNNNVEKNCQIYTQTQNNKQIKLDESQDLSKEKILGNLYNNKDFNINTENKKDNKDIIIDNTESINLKKKKINKKLEYSKFLHENQKHYYYIDNQDKEWEFREISGSKDAYYFKCSTTKCNGFGMIKRIDSNNFYLTKNHSIEYAEHTYFRSVITKYIKEGKKINEEDWHNKSIRIYIIKNYFEEYKNSNLIDCLNFLKEKLKNIIISEEDKNLLEEIKNCEYSITYKLRSFNNIIINLRNLKDKEGNNIITEYTYEHLNKITKNIDNLSMFFILNKRMFEQIRDKNNNQFFGDATFRCVPPTFRRFRLYIISSFNLAIKHSRIVAYILIPNETLITYQKMFEILKNKYFFEPIIFTCDFNKAQNKAIKIIYPNCYIINCFFHFAKANMKKLKKLGLTSKNNLSETIELLFNIKLLCFIKPDNIYSLYKKIKEKYKSNKFNEYFKYFQKQWNPKSNCKYINYYPNWNYYNILKSIDFDISHMFFTNNIAEHINKLLNDKLISKYPTFEKWKDTILKVESEVNLNNNIQFFMIKISPHLSKGFSNKTKYFIYI